MLSGRVEIPSMEVRADESKNKEGEGERDREARPTSSREGGKGSKTNEGEERSPRM